jgi:hypothetical protein
MPILANHCYLAMCFFLDNLEEGTPVRASASTRLQLSVCNYLDPAAPLLTDTEKTGLKRT